MNSPSSGGRKGNGSGPARRSARQQQVERLKGKVKKGIYRVKAEKVADKMVEDAVRSIRSRNRSG